MESKTSVVPERTLPVDGQKTPVAAPSEAGMPIGRASRDAASDGVCSLIENEPDRPDRLCRTVPEAMRDARIESDRVADMHLGLAEPDLRVERSRDDDTVLAPTVADEVLRGSAPGAGS